MKNKKEFVIYVSKIKTHHGRNIYVRFTFNDPSLDAEWFECKNQNDLSESVTESLKLCFKLILSQRSENYRFIFDSKQEIRGNLSIKPWVDEYRPLSNRDISIISEAMFRLTNKE